MQEGACHKSPTIGLTVGACVLSHIDTVISKIWNNPKVNPNMTRCNLRDHGVMKKSEVEAARYAAMQTCARNAT